MSRLRMQFQRWVWTVLYAALGWAVLPTALALAGLAPAPSMAMGDVCSAAVSAEPSGDAPAPVPSGHGTSCLLCVLSVPVVSVPAGTVAMPAAAEPATLGIRSDANARVSVPVARRACPQGPPALG